MSFCKILTNGLHIANLNTRVNFSACCYRTAEKYLKDDNIIELIDKHRTEWPAEGDDVISNRCKTCINQEKSGQYSLRNYANDNLSGTTNKLEFLSIIPGMQCNMACAICSPLYSSYWYQEELRNDGTRLNADLIELHNVSDPDFTEFYNAIFALDLTELKYLRFGGGEPFMMPWHAKVLKHIPHPENVTLHYASNFSIWPTQEILELWSKFKLVKWVASIDGTNEQFEYLRWPYKWNKLQEFTQKALADVPSNVMFGVEHTINCFNAYYFDRFEEWFSRTISTNREGDPTDFNTHQCSEEFRFSLIPPLLREAIIEKFGPSHQLSMMVKHAPVDTDYAASVKLWDKLYKDRGLNWKEVFPEIVPYYEDVL